MNRREAPRNHAASWPGPRAPSQEQQQRSLVPFAEVETDSARISVLHETVPHNPRQLPPLASSTTGYGVDGGHTTATSITVALPHIQRGRGSSAVCMSAAEVVPILVPREPVVPVWNIPQYSVRSVIRRSDHPLWSDSAMVQLNYLLDGGSSTRSCKGPSRLSSPDDKSHSMHAKGLVHSTRNTQSFSAVSELPQDTSEMRFYADEGQKCQSPPVLSTTVMNTGLEGYLTGRSIDRDIIMDPPHEREQQWLRLRPREFATLVPMLLRDECVSRQRIVEEERDEALRKIPLPPHAAEGMPHPAAAAGCRELDLLENIRRGHMLAEESACFERVRDLYAYVHRGMVVGTAPLKQFLLRWVWSYKGRKMRQLEQRKRLWMQEEISRGDITVEWWEAQQQLFAGMVVSTETLFRTAVEVLQLCTQYTQLVAHLRLKEQVERFPLLYGAVMPHAVVCGRISGHTVFKHLDLHEQHYRCQLHMSENSERSGIIRMTLREHLMLFWEVAGRQRLVEEESAMRVQLAFRLFHMRERFHLRELEIMEACERQLGLEPAYHALLAVGSEAEQRQRRRGEQAVLSTDVAQWCTG
ncbi:hypothetical protein DQ04_03861030 [Trypanosoma grayi]|uniref:hypothetical protein n=1 Tax=Trypanosoma grayi TaxID=71804 RepID=UPI0004F47B91|nr:hypothetical protein DQ04_03861030 [Trypanosoma grayi]KEG10337.1 hypothetical protein DQ04_03861030 [Trypanosoma grayi]